MAEKRIQACPACGKPYRPDKSTKNIFGVAAYGFKCKHCKYEGPGPLVFTEKDYKKFLKEVGEK